MPAECEVGGCGVLAVGRCGTCNSAFCATHQARSGNSRYIDYCSACNAADEAAKAAKDRAMAAANNPDLLSQAVGSMVEHNVPGLEDRTFRWETRRMVHRSFRKPIEQREVHEFVGAPAWPIGTLHAKETWDWNKEYHTLSASRECGVTKAGAIVLMPAGIFPTWALAGRGTEDTERIAPIFSLVQSGHRSEDVLDSDLRMVEESLPLVPSVMREHDVYKLSGDVVRTALRGLDDIARRHGIDLPRVLDWSDEVVSVVRA